ncbi:MAG: hypothetical protein JW749_11445 [Sedimentisphaerales bacterium]|nr:hypothetical protein [Sedimentisphaerales bacterium]
MTKASMGLAVVMVTLISLSVTGCQEEQVLQDEKTYRLIGAENIRLMGENEKLIGQINRLSQALAKCEEEKQTYKHRAEVEIKENVEGILKAAMDQNVAQRDEIERLQAEIAKLKGEAGSETEATPDQPYQEEPNEAQ